MRRTSSLSLALLVFLSLCLITFSVMTLSGAVSDQKLCEKSISRTTEYYEADAKVQSVLASLDTCLADYLDQINRQVVSESLTEEEIQSNYRNALRKLPEDLAGSNSDCVSVSFSNETSVLLFDVMIHEDQCIRSEILLTLPQADNDVLYQVISKKVVNLAQWSPDHSQNLLQR